LKKKKKKKKKKMIINNKVDNSVDGVDIRVSKCKEERGKVEFSSNFLLFENNMLLLFILICINI
jgi:hypothetical protein